MSEDDFMSLDDPSMTVTGKDLSTIPGILGPRKADGSLPDVGFLKLKAGSRAIDKGEDIGFPFAGSAPDLGAFEYGLSSSSAASSSSTTFIATNRNRFSTTPGSAFVFDIQGRYLGVFDSENVADALRIRFRNPGPEEFGW